MIKISNDNIGQFYSEDEGLYVVPGDALCQGNLQINCPMIIKGDLIVQKCLAFGKETNFKGSLTILGSLFVEKNAFLGGPVSVFKHLNVRNDLYVRYTLKVPYMVVGGKICLFQKLYSKYLLDINDQNVL